MDHYLIFVNFYGRHLKFLHFWKALKEFFSMMYVLDDGII